MARKQKRADDNTAADNWGTPIAGTPTLGATDRSTADVLRDDDRVTGQPGRGRTWLILLTSLLAQLVVIGAAGNPGVVGSASDYARDHASLLGRFGVLPAVFSWRIKQPTIDPGNLLASEWFGLLALVVVAALLTAVLVRGPVTFWRTGVAVWLAVLAGTLANGFVRRGVVNDRGRFDDVGGKASGVLFAGTGYEVIAGVIIGLIAALAAAIVAVMTRRPAELVVPAAAEEQPYAEPVAPPPWHGDDTRPPSDAVDPNAGTAAYPSGYQAGYQSEYAPSSYGSQSYGSPYQASYGAAGAAAADSDSATTTFPAQRPDGRSDDRPVDGPDDRSADRSDSDATTQFSAAGTSAADANADADTGGYRRPDATAEPEPQQPEPAPAASTPPAPETPETPENSETPAEQTAVLPAVPATPPSDFPRPPDDEELGHHPSEDEADRPRSQG